MTCTGLRAIFQKSDTQMPRSPAPKSAPRRVIVHPSKGNVNVNLICLAGLEQMKVKVLVNIVKKF